MRSFITLNITDGCKRQRKLKLKIYIDMELILYYLKWSFNVNVTTKRHALKRKKF